MSRVREDLAKILYDQIPPRGFKWKDEPQWFRDKFFQSVDKILSHPRIAILSEDQSLPKVPFNKLHQNATFAYELAQKDMSDFRRIEVTK